MASILTLYLNNPIQAGSSAGLLTLTQPGASTSTTGWTTNSNASGVYSRQTYNVEVPSANFTSTAQPSGAPVNSAQDCWRISAATTGDFSAGTWYSSISVIAVTQGSNDRGRAYSRLWRSANADGTSATEITQGGMLGSIFATGLSTTVAQSSSASTQVAAFSLSNEYLFLQLAWQVTLAGGGASNDVLIRYGSLAQTNGSGLITTSFAATGGSVVAGAGYFNEYYKSLVQDML